MSRSKPVLYSPNVTLRSAQAEPLPIPNPWEKVSPPYRWAFPIDRGRGPSRGHYGKTRHGRDSIRASARGLRRVEHPLNPAFSAHPAADACALGRGGYVIERPDPGARL